jgi:hypothetical protein
MFRRATGMVMHDADDPTADRQSNDSTERILVIHITKHTGKDIDSQINN